MIELKTTPINRRYYINNNVIYKIVNTKLGEGGAVTHEEKNETTGEVTYTYSTNKLPQIKIKSGSNEVIYYLDNFLEVGDVWDVSDGDNSGHTSKVGAREGETLYTYFENKCNEEISQYITSHPTVTTMDFEYGKVNIIPLWMLETDSTSEITGNVVEKIDINTQLTEMKKKLVIEELELTRKNLFKKYGFAETDNFVEVIKTNNI